MPNKMAANKQRVSLVLEKRLVAMIDAEAERLGRTRTDVVVRALREHCRLDPIAASSTQITELQEALAAMRREQAAVLEGMAAENKALLGEIQEAKALAPAQAQKEPRKLTWGERLRGWVE